MQKEGKQKSPRKRFVHFWLWLQKNRPKKNSVDKGTEFAGELSYAFIRLPFHEKWRYFYLCSNVPLHSTKPSQLQILMNEARHLSLKRTTWKQRRDILASERGLRVIEVFTPPVINHLSWSGAVCPHSCFCVQQKKIWPPSQLQSRIFQSKNLYKIPRTKLIHLRRI